MVDPISGINRANLRSGSEGYRPPTDWSRAQKNSEEAASENFNAELTKGVDAKAPAGGLGSLTTPSPFDLEGTRTVVFRYMKTLGLPLHKPEDLTSESIAMAVIKAHALMAVEQKNFIQQLAEKRDAPSPAQQVEQENLLRQYQLVLGQQERMGGYMRRLVGALAPASADPVTLLLPAEKEGEGLQAWSHYSSRNPFLSVAEAQQWLYAKAKEYAPASVGYFTDTITSDNVHMVASSILRAAEKFGPQGAFGSKPPNAEILTDAINTVVHITPPKYVKAIESGIPARDELAQELHLDGLSGRFTVSSALQAAQFVEVLASKLAVSLSKEPGESELQHVYRLSKKLWEMTLEGKDGALQKLQSQWNKPGSALHSIGFGTDIDLLASVRSASERLYEATEKLK